jgi:hypothetical protein
VEFLPDTNLVLWHANILGAEEVAAGRCSRMDCAMRKLSGPRVLLWLEIQRRSDAEEERGMGACEGRSVGAPQRAGFVQSSLKFQLTVTDEV